MRQCRRSASAFNLSLASSFINKVKWMNMCTIDLSYEIVYFLNKKIWTKKSFWLQSYANVSAILIEKRPCWRGSVRTTFRVFPSFFRFVFYSPRMSYLTSDTRHLFDASVPSFKLIPMFVISLFCLSHPWLRREKNRIYARIKTNKS